MTIFWIFVFIGALIFTAVAVGYFGAYISTFIAAIIWTPFREIVRLCRNNQIKKALTLAASIAFAVGSLALLAWVVTL
jgi:hypothetical protein